MDISQAKQYLSNMYDKYTFNQINKIIEKLDDTEMLSFIKLINPYFSVNDYSCNKSLKRNDTLSFNTDETSQTHKLIIGDNYDALLNLQQYKNKIDVLYIDPPYGDNRNINYNKISRNNLLEMLYPRLMISKDLLSDSSLIFCSIDDNNYAYVKCMFDSVFGDKNFLGTLIWYKKWAGGNDSKNINIIHEYILVYCNKKLNTSNVNKFKSNIIYKYFDNDGRNFTPESLWVKDNISANTYYPIYVNPYKKNEFNFNLISPYKSDDYPIEVFPYMCTETDDIKSVRWFWCKDKFLNEYNNLCGAKLVDNKWKIYKRIYNDSLIPRKSILPNDVGGSHTGKMQLNDLGLHNKFKYPKNTLLMKYLIELHPDKNATVLDIFAGSGTTGQAVLELNKSDGGNRQFILLTNNEITSLTPNGIALDVTVKRLKRVMTGECYDGFKNFKWIKNNQPFGNNLEVFEILENQDDVYQTF